ncbi:hypothetical protein C2E23DRAFT_857853 [Lenzites betulinus]|nr:hypothetical protein C2E23DRAFT_857853 [Lenzites betulinus]
MFEPRTPVTIIARFTPYPAVLLASDEGRPLSSESVILRHRHLRQQQRVLSVLKPLSHAGAKPVRGKSLPPMYDKVPTRPEIPNNSIRPLSPNSTSIMPLGAEAAFTTHRGPLQITRYERGIRSQNEKTVWFASNGRDLLSTPPDLTAARVGDLYVHTRADGAKQAWLRSGISQWTSIELCHPHPQLRGYILNFCANGEPSWVTKDTMRTYKGRTKKRDKDQQVKGHQDTRSPSNGTSN